MSDDVRSYVKSSASKSQQNASHHKIFGVVDLYVIEPLPQNVNILNVINVVEEKVPPHIASGIEGFYIGHFKEFDKRGINAMYRDGAIYVTNDQDDEADMIDDMIHELAHAAEDLYSMEIYSDNKIQAEFLGKRRMLKNMIDKYGYLDNDPMIDFLELEYRKELDDYLYNELGYEKLLTFTTGLFIRPYATTGVREYFATTFEECLIGKPEYAKKISPQAYKKVMKILMREV